MPRHDTIFAKSMKEPSIKRINKVSPSSNSLGPVLEMDDQEESRLLAPLQPLTFE
jgi:hypothetical protein